MNKTECCYLTFGTLRCRRHAEFLVSEERRFMDTNTYACRRHVGKMLGSSPGGHTSMWYIEELIGEDGPGEDPQRGRIREAYEGG